MTIQDEEPTDKIRTKLLRSPLTPNRKEKVSIFNYVPGESLGQEGRKPVQRKGIEALGQVDIYEFMDVPHPNHPNKNRHEAIERIKKQTVRGESREARDEP